MIVSIPLPLLWTVKMAPLRKLVCGLWLCTGVFIMVATLLRCILCLQQADDINVGTIWSIRETVSPHFPQSFISCSYADIFSLQQFVAIIAVNIPVLGPWIAKSAKVISKGSQGNGESAKSDNLVTIGQQSNRLDRLTKDGRGWTNLDADSEERIVSSTATSTNDARRESTNGSR